MQKVITEAAADIAPRLTACTTTLQGLITEDVSAGAKYRPTPFLVAMKDETRGNPEAFTEPDDLDGPTVIEVR